MKDSKIQECRICNKSNELIFTANIINKYKIGYFHCSNCKFLQTEKPYWLEEVYKESINVSDTGIIRRNIRLANITSLLLFFLFNKNGKFIDYAGGYGIFTRLMRDIGFDFYYNDPYTTNLVARGFEADNEIIEQVNLITSFESFEHFENPIIEIEKMLKISKNILFSTTLLPDPIPKPEEWWYFGLEHGQHVSIYSIETLRFIANKYNLNLLSNGIDTHLLTEKNINPIVFKIILKLHRLRLYHLVKRKMRSLTISDMELMIQQGKK